MLIRGLAAAALVAAVVVPVASARSSARINLALLPLQKAQVGSAVKALPLEHDSGVVSNAAAASHSLAGTTPKALAKLGRTTGYALDYGIGASGGSGVTEVRTSVDEYKTSADAKRGLAFWEKDDSGIAQLNQGGLAVTNQPLPVPAVGKATFAFLSSYSAGNIVPFSQVDEQFTEGRYEIDVNVSAGTAGEATKLAPSLARKLDVRLRHALVGELHAKPVKGPGKQQAGTPAGVPDLTRAALSATDFTGTAMVANLGYFVDPSAVSDYSLTFFPAGQFAFADQEIEWFATANLANFWADRETASALSGGGTPVDLSGVGPGAQGAIISDPSAGDFGVVALTSGNLTESLYLIGNPSIQSADVQGIAKTAANYINSAGLGS